MPLPNPEPLSIRERIERELAATLIRELALPARDVQRFDIAGNEVVPDPADGSMPEYWVLVSSSDEDQLDDGPESAIGYSEIMLPVLIDAHLVKKPDGLTTSEWANRTIARLKFAIKSNMHMEEGGANGVGANELAIDTKILGSYGPGSEEEGRELICGIECEIHYRHLEADPYTRG